MSEEMKNASNNNENNAVIVNDEDDNDMAILIEQDEDDIDELEVETTSGLDSLDKEFNRSTESSSNANNQQVKLNANSNNNQVISNDNVVNSLNNKSNANNDEDEESNDGWATVGYKLANKVSEEIDSIEKTDEFDEVEEDEIEAKNNANSNVNVGGGNQNNVANKGQSGGWFSAFKQNGKYNTRPIVIAALAIGFIVAILFSSSTSNKDKDKNAKLVAPPEPSRMVENRVDNDELEPVTTRYFPEPEKTEDPRPLPTVTIPPAVLPAPGEPVKSGSPVQPGKPVEVEDSKEFGIELRAGTEAALKKVST